MFKFYLIADDLLIESSRKDDYPFLERGSEIAEGIDDVEEFHITEVFNFFRIQSYNFNSLLKPI